MDYTESVNYLHALGHEVLAAKFGLDNIRLLLEKLDRPDRSYKSVLVAGTNGKGSVAAMIESIACAAGVKVGLYTSPHLTRVEERIRFCGREISQQDFASVASEVREASESLVLSGKVNALPTFFEQLTAIALRYFELCEARLAVLEIGVGGKSDAVNSVDGCVSVITAIDYDHQNILGDDIKEIAAIKSAIIKLGTSAVIGRQRHEEATEVLMRRCLEAGVLPAFVKEPTKVTVGESGQIAFDYESSNTVYSRMAVGLKGRHQVENAAAAIETAEALREKGFIIPRAAMVKGLRNVNWQGRLELIDERPCILLDGAHNVAGAIALRSYLDEFWKENVTLIFGSMSDKDISGIASELFAVAKTIILTKVNDIRAASVKVMSEMLPDPRRDVICCDSVAEAISRARHITPPEGLICAAGSLHLVGEVKRLLELEHASTQFGT